MNDGMSFIFSLFIGNYCLCGENLKSHSVNKWNLFVLDADEQMKRHNYFADALFKYKGVQSEPLYKTYYYFTCIFIEIYLDEIFFPNLNAVSKII